MEKLADVALDLQRFSWTDYLMFLIMLLLCICIGIYFGFVEKTESTESEYLVGGRNMSLFPVAMSLISRYLKYRNLDTKKL